MGWWDVSKCSHSMEKSFHTWKKWLGGTVLDPPFEGNSLEAKVSIRFLDPTVLAGRLLWWDLAY